LDPKPASTASTEVRNAVFCFQIDRIGLSGYLGDLQNWIHQLVSYSKKHQEDHPGNVLEILMVDIDTVIQRIVDAEKKGRRLSKKTVFRLCGYDRSVIREVFRRLRLMTKKEQTLSKWLESQGNVA